MKKSSIMKFVSVCLALWMLLCVAPFSEFDFSGILPRAQATVVSSGKCGDNATWTMDDEGTVIISGTGNIQSYFYVEEENYIGGTNHHYGIKKVIIEAGITGIGEAAFHQCFNMTSVEIPEGVTYIKESAFYDCRSLTSVVIPSTVRHIGWGAFIYCGVLSSVVLPEKLDYLGDKAFLGDPVALYVNPDSDTAKLLTEREIPFNNINSTINNPFVKIYVNMEGDGSVSAPAYAPKGQTVYVFAADTNCFSFAGWYQDGSLVSDAKTYSVTANADVTLTAKFSGGHQMFSNTTAVTCATDGYTESICTVCGKTNRDNVVPATGNHLDKNNDSRCDTCGIAINCSCNCHKGGIKGFFFKIKVFFRKLFNMKDNQICACGCSHW